jgi:hypothetical protein
VGHRQAGATRRAQAVSPSGSAAATTAAATADTALFYSATNCFPQALQGLQLTAQLMMLVQERIGRRYTSLKRFVTLSPIPGLQKWLRRAVLPVLGSAASGANGAGDSTAEGTLPLELIVPPWMGRSSPKLAERLLSDAERRSRAEQPRHPTIFAAFVSRWTALYLLFEKRQQAASTPASRTRPASEGRAANSKPQQRWLSQKALDPVINFHIQNGAILARILPAASNMKHVSRANRAEVRDAAAPSNSPMPPRWLPLQVCSKSLGVMVNYQYPGPTRQTAARAASARYRLHGLVPFRGSVLPLIVSLAPAAVLRESVADARSKAANQPASQPASAIPRRFGCAVAGPLAER